MAIPNELIVMIIKHMNVYKPLILTCHQLYSLCKWIWIEKKQRTLLMKGMTEYISRHLVIYELTYVIAGKTHTMPVVNFNSNVFGNRHTRIYTCITACTKMIVTLEPKFKSKLVGNSCQMRYEMIKKGHDSILDIKYVPISFEWDFREAKLSDYGF